MGADAISCSKNFEDNFEHIFGNFGRSNSLDLTFQFLSQNIVELRYLNKRFEVENPYTSTICR